MRAAVLVLLLAAGGARGADPSPVTFDAVMTAAADDAERLPTEVARYTRYLTAYHLQPEARRELFAVLCYHVNGLSREVKLTAPREVAEWLWAVDLRDYRWDAGVWENLAPKNVYFCVVADIKLVPGVPPIQPVPPPVKKTRKVLVGPDRNGFYREVVEEYEEPGPVKPAPPAAVPVKEEKGKAIPAPWLSPRAVARLGVRTGSVTPVVRADHFIRLTGVQSGNEGHGYYDFLGLGKKLADAEKQAKLDRAGAIEIYRELAGIVPVSGVALFGRQVFRFQTIAGSWWESRDTKEPTKRRDPVTNLLDDFQFDATEIVASLPNGLPFFFLADKDGNRQDTAPDFIAADHRSTNNDRRVHVGMSCIACHADGGLRDIKDYARRIYDPEKGLALAALAADDAKARRIHSVYLGPLKKAYDRDVRDYGEAIEGACGLKGKELPKAYEREWSRYLDDPVTLVKAAAECGTTPAALRDRLRTAAKQKLGLTDAVLAVYLLDDPPPVRREAFEERMVLLMVILGGGNP